VAGLEETEETEESQNVIVNKIGLKLLHQIKHTP
jgi:hypothetical protein